MRKRIESLLSAHRTACCSPRIKSQTVIPAITRSLSFFSAVAWPSRFIALQVSPTYVNQLPLLARGECSPETWNAPARSNSPRNSQTADLVLQRRTFESEPCGGPPVPAVRPAAARNPSMITPDSAALKVEGELKATNVSEQARSVAIGTSSSGPRVTITRVQRSLPVPGHLPSQGLFVSNSIACVGIHLICLPIRRDSFETK
jgi:hypothetical protein